MLNDENEKKKKHDLKNTKKKKKLNSDESPKLRLIFKTHNPWNPRPELNKKTQFPSNLMLNMK
jgi:hypothetical protein